MVFYLTIPLMVIAVAMAVLPLVLTILWETRNAGPTLTTVGPPVTDAPATGEATPTPAGAEPEERVLVNA